jgi:hypothetical protein
MGKTTAEYLTSIAASKEAIRQAITVKGQACGKSVPLSQYAQKIMAISTAEFFQCVFVSNGAWSGYKAVLENGKYRFETTITEGLEYTSVTPEVGKIYTGDALAQIAYLYDIGGMGGECPNLADCVTTTCPTCNEEYCQTHGSHTCEGGGGGDDDKKCPDLPTCNEITCVACGEKYCETHAKHECDGDNSDPDNPDGPNNPSTKPGDCPFTMDCQPTLCPDCGYSYCKTHDQHTCNEGECPKGKDCIPTSCGCGAKYCARHEIHPTDICCTHNIQCNIEPCEKCGVEYCRTHGSHEKCCPDAPGCQKLTCAIGDCNKIWCKTHDGDGYSCSVCGKYFCSKECYIEHECTVDEYCTHPDCDNKAYQKCVKCQMYYCLDHLTNHACDGDKCAFPDCNNEVASQCADCLNRFCALHLVACPEEGHNHSVCVNCVDNLDHPADL